ncbi:MAG: hypothetical protein P9L99_19100 [Candidatus Lernaella stagnicola]|nr:hypothetical protein [Candidatus Lernaella stagnicola]
MDDRQIREILAPETPKADPELLAREEALWEALTADLGNEDLHKQYVGFVLKNNLLTTGSRRYGGVIDDKDEYSVDERRLARTYQQNLVRILFFDPREHDQTSKLTRLELLFLFVTTMLTMAGLFALFMDLTGWSFVAILLMRLMFPLGLAVVVLFIWRRARTVTSAMEKDKY